MVDLLRASISLANLSADFTPMSMITLMKVLDKMSSVAEMSLKLAIRSICELWIEKDLPEKTSFIISTFITIIKKSLSRNGTVTI